MTKDWIDIIRSNEYFNLAVTNRDNKVIIDGGLMSGGDGGIMTTYDTMSEIQNHSLPESEIPPNYMSMSDGQSLVASHIHGQNDQPHAEDPAPAQRCGNMALLWVDLTTEYIKIKEGLPLITHMQLHRDDGYPAMIEAINLAKHYKHGNLHRKGQHPAIRADFIIAHWFKNGTLYRSNGPAKVTIRGYKEYWNEGQFIGHKWDWISLDWNNTIYNDDCDDEDTLGDFLENISGTENPFSNRYFSDSEDEVIFMTDFA